jgi:hypothetical protein
VWFVASLAVAMGVGHLKIAGPSFNARNGAKVEAVKDATGISDGNRLGCPA